MFPQKIAKFCLKFYLLCSNVKKTCPNFLPTLLKFCQVLPKNWALKSLYQLELISQNTKIFEPKP